MAKIIEQFITVKFSSLVRDDNDSDIKTMIPDGSIELIDAALQEVLEVRAGVVVEVIES